MTCRPRAYGDQPAAMGFALALALRRLADAAGAPPAAVVPACAAHEREHGRLYGHGLERLGLPRHRFVTITLKKPASLLWTMEEALKSGAVAAVLGDAEAAHADLTVTRRLSLAAAAGKCAGILTFARPDASATASHTRWTAAAVPSRSPPMMRRRRALPAGASNSPAPGAAAPAPGFWNGIMRSLVSLWFPDFPVERFIRARIKTGRKPPTKGLPFALVESGKQGLRLIAVNATARSFGLMRGMRLADARAQLPELLTEPHEPEEDMNSLLGLCRWMERYSPWVAPDPPDGILLDVTGVPHLFGGEQRMMAEMQHAGWRNMASACRIGQGATLGAAWALARYEAKDLQCAARRGAAHRRHGGEDAAAAGPQDGGRAAGHPARLARPALPRRDHRRERADPARRDDGRARRAAEPAEPAHLLHGAPRADGAGHPCGGAGNRS